MSILREDIVNAIKTRLAALTTTGGYHNTLTGKVFIWEGTPPQSGVTVDVRDTVDVITDYLGNKWRRRLTVEIELTTDGSTSAAVIRSLIEDIWKSIGTDPTWGALAADTQPKQSEIQVDQEGNRVTGGKAEVEILYGTGAWSES